VTVTTTVRTTGDTSVLTELHIENLGVIEHAVLVLDGGLTALTGETGAGKTMLVEAIDLLVGGRADATVVRAGAAEARIDGRLMVDIGEGPDEVVLTRVIPADGRSRAYVNGRPATVARLAELTRDVIDLHGQHAHQGLLSVGAQRAALDDFARVELAPLAAARARVTEIDAELAALGGDERARAREIDLLRFQVAELDGAAIADADEDVALAREEALLADAVAHREAGAAAIDALRGDAGTTDSLGAALAALGHRDPFDPITQRLLGVSAELDDLAAELRNTVEAIEEDPERLAAVRERRQLLVDLRRKYGDDLAEVMAFHADAERRLRELEQYDRRAAALDGERHAAIVAEREAAAVVGRRRREAAPALAAAVEQRLQTLAMPNAAIAIEVGEHADDHPGDQVRLLLAANPGSPPLPLARVASGGELARAMLALRLVLSGVGDSPSAGATTLVFDEVDAGIGGTAASAVAAALAELGRTRQVLVVTHLPQVAAAATRQLAVAKTVVDDATFATVAPVEGEDRVVELARMLSGSDTATARDHARDLLARPVR
jgi:DNA repair protein RecN (Recombination protein N)